MMSQPMMRWDNDDMPLELLILVGLQGSGKSSFYREWFASTHVHVSRDNFRHNRNPERRQRQLLKQAFAEGKSAVVDNTSPTQEDRKPLVALGKEAGAVVVSYFFPASAQECVARNAAREGHSRVPDVAIYATQSRLVRPASTEGYDRMYEVYARAGTGFEIVQIWPGGMIVADAS